MLNSVPIGTMKANGQPVSVILEPVLKPQSEADLENLTVMTDAGPKPASSVAEWSRKSFRRNFSTRTAKAM
ncbi:hypothetical protein [Cohnella faecalis]|uniref:hypothetical protein n=1 Tax=Cohnella faecalis TaxID=2315694 RepID=UPI0011C21233|nr:hypothetical protein [Cohnella faecalis]